MTLWQFLKETPKLLMLEEIAAFLLFMAGIFGFFIIAYGFMGG